MNFFHEAICDRWTRVAMQTVPVVEWSLRSACESTRVNKEPEMCDTKLHLPESNLGNFDLSLNDPLITC